MDAPPKKEELPTVPEGKKSELVPPDPRPKSEPPPASEPEEEEEEEEEEAPASGEAPPSAAMTEAEPAPVEVAGPKWGLIALVALATLVISYLFARYLR